METALRVLSALTAHQYPAPEDVAELRRCAPLLEDAPLDELACDVIQQALKRRAELRKALRAPACD